ncbi:MAG: TIGR03016 family PEP-CTERM system-associated outer membrane protein [Burkholderiales bacterium]|nr:TIGR03016 family PEP-CTERM system-associated outer membrane protein [Burkholderiales bacterium]
MANITRFPRALAIFTISIAQTSHAADWKVTPHAHASETYSDNLTLAGPNQEIGDFISEVTPGINLQETGSRTKASLDYSLQRLSYKNQNRLDHVYSHLVTMGEADLIEKSMFLDANASISQQPISLNAAIGANNSNPTGNIVNVATWSLSPYLKHRFGSAAQGEIRFTHQAQSYSSGGPSNTGIGTLSNSTNNSMKFALSSGTMFNNLLWGLSYNNSKIGYTARPDSRLTDYSASIGYIFTPKFKIMLTGGNENNSYVYIGAKPQGAYWSTEATWAPTSHTKVSVAMGQRYFGKTQSMTLNHVTRLTSLQAAYSQDVTAGVLQQSMTPAAVLDQLLKAQIPNNAARQQAVQSMLASLGTQAALLGQSITTNQVYLHKKFTTTMGINLPKSIIVLTAFSSSSSSLEQGGSFLQGSVNYGAVNQQGGTASWNWQISPKLSSNISATLTAFDFPGQNLKENSSLYLFGLTRKFAHGMSGNISYRRQAFDSNPAILNYAENAIIASLSYQN